MGKGIISFVSGILVGFGAGVMMDSEKRKKLRKIAIDKSNKLKDFEKVLKKKIEKLKKSQ